MEQLKTTLINYPLAFLFVLTVVVFFHELGHYWVARRCGVKIEEFSIGFGKELFGFNDKNGTRWKLCLIPLGGYVKFFGDMNAASAPDNVATAKMSEAEKAVSFPHKNLWQKAAIVVAGPLANFILAIVIFAGVFMINGKATLPPRLDVIMEGGAAAKAGLKAGDIVREVEGRKIESFNDFQRLIAISADVSLDIVVEREGKPLNITLIPERMEIKDTFGNVQKLGRIQVQHNTNAGDGKLIKMSPLEAVQAGVKETGFIIDQTLTFLGRMFKGKESADQLGGPIRIFQAAGQAASLGFSAVVLLTAVLSVSIGLVNLFPIPLLDGGHLVMYALEGIFRRPISPQIQEYIYRFGFVFLMSLMLFTTFNDIKPLSGFFK